MANSWNYGGTIITGLFGVQSDWSAGAPPAAGQTGVLGFGKIKFDTTVPANLTLDVGESEAYLSPSLTSSTLVMTDTLMNASGVGPAATPTGLVINDTSTGGLINPAASGPVVLSGLAINGQVTLSSSAADPSSINIGAGDAELIGIAGDSPTTTTTGYFDNQGTINVQGNIGNFAYLDVAQGNGNGNASTGAYAAYGTVNVSYGVVVASAPDASPTNVAIGSSQFNLSDYGELQVVNTIFQNATVDFDDNTDELLLGLDGQGQFVYGGTIDGFQTGDVIGLMTSGAAPASIGVNSTDTATTVTIWSGANQTGTDLGAITLQGNYTSSTFALTQNASSENSAYTAQYDISITPTPSVSVTIAQSGSGGAALDGGKFSEFLGFGDSDIDSGYFLNTPISTNSTVEAQYKAAVAAGGGVPTSIGGTMNSVLLADYFNLSAAPYNPINRSSGSTLGTNYAASGATITGGLLYSLAPSITSQIATYLAPTAGGDTADPNALYLLSGGGNDVKIAEELTTAQGDAYMVSEANADAAAIEQLHADGAQYIVIDNMTGNTSFGLLFNRTLDTDLGAAGVPFLNGNADAMLLNLEANPSGTAYGVPYNFTNVSPAPQVTGSTPYNQNDGAAALNPDSNLFTNSWSLFATQTVGQDAGATDLWADDEHLAATGQQIEAAYFEHLIETGTPTVGETLSANPQVVNGDGANFSFQWQALSDGGWTNIAGQTGSTFTVAANDVGEELRVQTTFTDAVTDASTSAFSAPTFDVAPCYCRGTLVETDKGEIAVEDLAIGDRVKTLSGAFRPIKWIGARAYDGRFIRGNRDVLPIRVKAGALGEGVPVRDLWISPNHALYLEGVLIEAKDLVNGASIVQAEHVDGVAYIHIELFAHDVIFAEGAPAESFIDNDSRAMFHNAAEFFALYPDAKTRRRKSFAPRRDQGFEVEAAREKIAARAGRPVAPLAAPGGLRGWIDGCSAEGVWGWAQDESAPDTPVCLHILGDGHVLGRVLANRYRADLQTAGLGRGRHAFVFEAPRGVDLSRLRIEIRRAEDGAALAA